MKKLAVLAVLFVVVAFAPAVAECAEGEVCQDAVDEGWERAGDWCEDRGGIEVHETYFGDDWQSYDTGVVCMDDAPTDPVKWITFWYWDDENCPWEPEPTADAAEMFKEKYGR